MNWIDVSEKLPENEGRARSKAVLVYCPDIKCQFTACYNFEAEKWEYFACASAEIYYLVSHWMDLPDCP
jgi:antirestriction protein